MNENTQCNGEKFTVVPTEAQGAKSNEIFE